MREGLKTFEVSFPATSVDSRPDLSSTEMANAVSACLARHLVVIHSIAPRLPLCLHPQLPHSWSPWGSGLFAQSGATVSLTSPTGKNSWGTHRGTYTGRGHVCPNNGPACPSRPQRAPSRGSGGSEGAKVRLRAEWRASPIPVYSFTHVCDRETG